MEVVDDRSCCRDAKIYKAQVCCTALVASVLAFREAWDETSKPKVGITEDDEWNVTDKLIRTFRFEAYHACEVTDGACVDHFYGGIRKGCARA
jgi:hypothetical protein